MLRLQALSGLGGNKLAYVVYENLKNPNEVLAKMVEYIKSRGYSVVEDLKDDTNIYKRDVVDGKKFVFMDRTNTYFIYLRSANGTDIFGLNDDADMDAIEDQTIEDRHKHKNFYGIGATVGEGYSKKQRWYNQFQVPTKFRNKEVQAVWIPVIPREDTEQTLVKSDTPETVNKNKYKLYCNNVLKPNDTLIFSVVAENIGGDVRVGHDYRCVHLVFGNLYKYDSWDGGMFFSGSSVPNLMREAGNIFRIDRDYGVNPLPLDKDGHPRKDYASFHTIADGSILPVLSSGQISNTFLRIDIDEAPYKERGDIRWASSGTDNVTGKPMSLPVRVHGGGNGEIPHYKDLQSNGNLDWGRDINTLNCLTLNMPIYMAVRVDPDILNNYAGAGQVAGVYFACSLNMQSTGVYEMSYPRSGDLCQIFSHSMRRGRFGYDAISIRQNEDDSDSFAGDITTDTTRTYGV